MILSNLIIYCMAVWRISSLLVQEDGPFFVFRKIRKFAGITHDDFGNKIEIPNNFLAQVLSCVWCSSIWVSLFMLLFIFISQYWAFRFGVIMAFSAGAIMINTYVNGK